MRRLTSLASAVLCISLGTTAFAGNSDDGDDDNCRRIHAQIDLTHATIEGNFGLNGTVAFAQDSSGTPPATAPANASVFSGLLTITTARGNLVLRETGMFSSRTGNPAGSVLASWGESLSGTQRFAGVTGDLFFAGRVAGSIFLVDVTGRLCKP
jgi:hypothetical protein